MSEDWDKIWNMGNFRIWLNRAKGSYNFIYYKKLLKDVKINNPEILELGCGLGILSEKLIDEFGGSACLVDSSKNALSLTNKTFKYQDSLETYCDDIFKLNLNGFHNDKFDIVHSQGVVEHFNIKKQIELMDIHKKFVKDDGFVIIFVPRKTFVWKIENMITGYDEDPMETEELAGLGASVGLKAMNAVKTPDQVGVLFTNEVVV